MSLQVSPAPSGPSSDLPQGPLPAPTLSLDVGEGCIQDARRAPGCSEEVGCDVPGLWGLPCGALGPVPVPRLPGPRRPRDAPGPTFPFDSFLSPPAAPGPAGRSLPWSPGSWISEVPSARKRGLDSRTVALPRGLPRPRRKFLGVTWGGLPTHPPTDPFVHLWARQPCFSAAAELTGWEDAPRGWSTPPGDSPIRGRTQHRALCVVCRVPRGGLQPPSCLPQPGQWPSLIPILVLAHLAFGLCGGALLCAWGL